MRRSASKDAPAVVTMVTSAMRVEAPAHASSSVHDRAQQSTHEINRQEHSAIRLQFATATLWLPLVSQAAGSLLVLKRTCCSDPH